MILNGVKECKLDEYKPRNILDKFLEHKLYLGREDRVDLNAHRGHSRVKPPHAQSFYDVPRFAVSKDISIYTLMKCNSLSHSTIYNLVIEDLWTRTIRSAVALKSQWKTTVLSMFSPILSTRVLSKLGSVSQHRTFYFKTLKCLEVLWSFISYQ